jgi:hypothetical protein
VVFAFPVQAQTPIRISGDSAARNNLAIIDSNTLQSVQWVRGDYVRVEVGLFDKGVFISNNISRFGTVTLALFQSQADTNAPMMLQTVTNGTTYWNSNCSYAAWSNNVPPYTNY